MKSLSNRIAALSSLFLAIFIMLFSVIFIVILRFNVRTNESRKLATCAVIICENINSNDDSRFSINLPYYVSYVIFDSQSGTIIYTNDPFLPMLPETNNKTKRYISKNYFSDGDLDILYYSMPAEIQKENQIQKVTVQTSLSIEQDNGEQILSMLPRGLLFVFIPILLISYLISFLISRSSLKPVVQMTKKAQTISSENLLAELPQNGKGDELDTLASTFNGLFKQLKRDFDRERAFTADVSHELKIPIAVVLGQANLVRRWGKNDPAQLNQSIDAIIAESHSMESIVSNLLQLSRLESGKIQPELQETNIKQVALRLYDDTKIWSPETDINSEKIDEKLFIYTDKELLHQVFTILVSNSIKFSSKSAQISISTQTESEKIIITYSDNGPGISEEILPHVFERFYRGDVSHSRKTGGNGLGLSIAKQIMTVLNGSIEASSAKNGGHGAVFTLTLSK